MQAMHYTCWSARDIQLLRSHIGMTQWQFGRQVGVRRSTVSEWERGERTANRQSCILLTMLANQTGYWPDISGDPRLRYGTALQIADQ